MTFSFKKLRAQSMLQVFALSGIAFLIVFAYIPMLGIIIAFKDYRLGDGLMGFITTPWVGLKNFKEFFSYINCLQIIRNTVFISLLKLVFSFPIPIIFALALNELRNKGFKRVMQTVSYLPHFISWVIISGFIFTFLNNQDGLINQLLKLTGITNQSISFLSQQAYFWPILVVGDIWKETGWSAIIFIAAISSIDPTMYESAVIDGAGRLRLIWSITLPNIKGTVLIILILSMGGLFGGGSSFEQCLLLGNSLNSSVSEIVQTYVLKVGLTQGRVAYATAIGLFQSVISFVLIFFSNYYFKRTQGIGIY
jgi:putative aldouronate transport system permease protein